MSRTKGAKNKPKPLTPEGVNAIRLAALVRGMQEAEARGDSALVLRFNTALQKLNTKTRPKGIQPDSYHGRRAAAEAAHSKELQRRRDEYQAEQAERAVRTNASMPVPIVTEPINPMDVACQRETPSVATLQVRESGVEFQSRQSAQTPPPPTPKVFPTPPPPVPILVPTITLGSIPCSPSEFERLRRISADIDAQVDERIRQKAAEETAEEHRREEAAYIEYQKAQKEAQDRYRRTCPSPVPQGMPVADFDCDDSRICRSDAPEHRDGYFVLEEKPSGETRHNLTLGNF
jgi:hypothetical protein